MRVLVILLLVLVGSLVLASRFGRDTRAPTTVVEEQGSSGADANAPDVVATPEVGSSAPPSNPEGETTAARQESAPEPQGELSESPAEADREEPETNAAAPSGDETVTLQLDPSTVQEEGRTSDPLPLSPEPDEAAPAEEDAPLTPSPANPSTALAAEPSAPPGDALAPTEPEGATELPAEPLDPADALAALSPEADDTAQEDVAPRTESEEAPSTGTTTPPSPGTSPPAENDGAPDATAALPQDDAVTRRPAEAPAPPSSEPTEPPPDLRQLTGDRVNLREGPGTDQPVRAVLPVDTEVEVLETEGGWLRVRTPDGQEGWVAARFVAPPPG